MNDLCEVVRDEALEVHRDQLRLYLRDFAERSDATQDEARTALEVLRQLWSLEEVD